MAAQQQVAQQQRSKEPSYEDYVERSVFSDARAQEPPQHTRKC